MDSLERLMRKVPPQQALTAASRTQNAFVQASLCSVIGRKGRHLTGTFCLTGDTMEGIIQCLVFLKAFSNCPAGTNASSAKERKPKSGGERERGEVEWGERAAAHRWGKLRRDVNYKSQLLLRAREILIRETNALGPRATNTPLIIRRTRNPIADWTHPGALLFPRQPHEILSTSWGAERHDSIVRGSSSWEFSHQDEQPRSADGAPASFEYAKSELGQAMSSHLPSTLGNRLTNGVLSKVRRLILRIEQAYQRQRSFPNL